MPKLSCDVQNNIKSLILKKLSLREISKLTNVPKSTIERYAKEKKIKTEGASGRKKKLNSRNVTYCVTQLCSNQVKTAQELVKTLEKDQGVKVHRTTIANSEKNRKDRLAFAKSHKDWTVEDWKTVIFSDETKINRFGSDGQKWTWFRGRKFATEKCGPNNETRRGPFNDMGVLH